MSQEIVQFGTSRFLQAHADLFVHEAATPGDPPGRIVVVAGSGSAQNRQRLAAFDDPAGFPVIIRGMQDGKPLERQVQVTSVSRGLDAQSDWADLVDTVVRDARFVISNTTEAGLTVPPNLALDLSRPVTEPPPTYPARLLALLTARFHAGEPGLVLLPTELVGRNGDTLAQVVQALARRSGAPDALLAWLAQECVFANSLVDRIVSEPIEPAGAVTEPYALWAVEARPGLRLPCVHPAIRVVDDLEPVERLKIHILNLGHTVLAEHWQAAGSPAGMTVREVLDQAGPARMLEAVYAREVVPGFRARGMGPEAERYVATTLDRFRNPFLRHLLSDIAVNHVTKVDKRIRGFLAWAGTASPTLEGIVARHATGA